MAGLPLRADTVMLFPMDRGARGAADYANIRDSQNGGANTLDDIVAAAQTGGPLIMGGRRVGDNARAWHTRTGFSNQTRMSGTASAASRAACVGTAWTIMGWANVNFYNAAVGNAYFIGCTGVSGNLMAENALMGILFTGADGQMTIRYESGGGVDTTLVFSGSPAIPTGAYFHWCITRSQDGGGGSNFELWINGVSVDTINQAVEVLPDGGTNSRWHMGQRFHDAANDDLTSARQQDVAFFDVELSPAEIATFAISALDFDDTHADLIAHWPCDEEPDLPDLGVDGQHMLFIDDAELIDTSLLLLEDEGSLRLLGDSGTAGSLTTRVTEFMRAALASPTLTFMFWLQFPVAVLAGANRQIFRWGGSADAADGSDNTLLSIIMATSYALQLFHENDAGVNSNWTSAAIVAGSDRFARKLIAVRRNDVGGGDVTYSVLVDGVLVDTSPSLTAPNSGSSGTDQNTNNWFGLFGAFYGAEHDLPGHAGSVALYSSALTDEEILAIFDDAGSAPVPPPAIPVTFPLDTEDGGPGFQLRTTKARNLG